MKGRKCIGLLIFCITCLLSLSLFSNANAAENVGWWATSVSTDTDAYNLHAEQGTGDYITYLSQTETSYITDIRAWSRPTVTGQGQKYGAKVKARIQINCAHDSGYVCSAPIIYNPVKEYAVYSANEENPGRYSITLLDAWTEVAQAPDWAPNNTKINYYFVFYIAPNNGGAFTENPDLYFRVRLVNYPHGLSGVASIPAGKRASLDGVYYPTITLFDSAESGELNALNQNVTNVTNILIQSDEKDQQDRDNLQNQQDSIDSDADDLQDDVENATSSISSNISSILGALSTSASDCLISVQAGDNGVLQLTDMNLCSMPTEMHTLVHTISSIIVTLAVLWISFNLLSQFLDIYENYLGAGGIKK